MPMLIRVAGAFMLLVFTSFCIFGFLASYEPPGFPGWRLIYGAVILVSLTGVGGVLTRRTKAEEVAGSEGE